MLKLVGIVVLSVLIASCSSAGDRALRQGDFEVALAEFNAELADNPDDVVATLGRGHTLLALGLFQDAIDGYSNAIELAGDDVQLASSAYASRGWVYRFLLDYDTAFMDYMTALELDDESWLAHYNRAQTYLALERYADAISGFTRAIEIDPDEGRAYFFRGEAYYQEERYVEGDADFDTACEQGFSLYDSSCAS